MNVGGLSVNEMNATVCQGREFRVVGNDNEGLSELIAQVEEKLVKFGLVPAVELARRFIGKDHVGPIHQCPCHSHTLFLASRKL